MRLIVSGAGGFLGSNIIKTAAERGIDVLAITGSADLGSCPIIASTDDFLESGCLLDKKDIFINCLFPTNADGPKMADGLDKVFRMTDMAKRCGAGAFINISSQSVYASKRLSPAKESDLLSLETPYAVGKYSSEVLVNHIYAGNPHTNIRMASLLGVGYDQRIVNRMADRALKGEELSVVGGMQRYGFLDVRDAADGILRLALGDPDKWREIYNLGRNENYTLIEVAECIVKEIKEITGQEITYCVSEGRDERNSSLDASLFMKDFDWSPKFSLSETTAAIIRSKIGKA